MEEPRPWQQLPPIIQHPFDSEKGSSLLTIPIFSKYDIDDAVSHVSAAVDSRSGAWIREVLSQVTPQLADKPPTPNTRRDPSTLMDTGIWDIWEHVCRSRPNSESPVLGGNRNSYYAIFCVMLLKAPFTLSKSVRVIARAGRINFVSLAFQYRNETAVHALIDSGLFDLNSRKDSVRFPLHQAIRSRVSIEVFGRILEQSNTDTLNAGETWKSVLGNPEMKVPWTPLLLLIDNIRFYKNRIVDECQCIQLLLKRVCMEDPSAGLHLTDDAWLRVDEPILHSRVILPLSKEEFVRNFNANVAKSAGVDLVFSPREFLALTARELVSPYDNSALLIKTPPLNETETDIITKTLELLRRIPE